MTNQELRAASLQIAAQILGPLPVKNPDTWEGINIDNPGLYKGYVWLVGHISRYIEQGDDILLKKPR